MPICTVLRSMINHMGFLFGSHYYMKYCMFKYLIGKVEFVQKLIVFTWHSHALTLLLQASLPPYSSYQDFFSPNPPNAWPPMVLIKSIIWHLQTPFWHKGTCNSSFRPTNLLLIFNFTATIQMHCIHLLIIVARFNKISSLFIYIFLFLGD